MTTLQDQQKAEALARANEVRAAHANIRLKLSGIPRTNGLRETARLLSIRDQRIERLQVRKLLGYCRHVGPKTAELMAARAQISASKRVCELTDRGRERLVVEVRRTIDG